MFYCCCCCLVMMTTIARALESLRGQNRDSASGGVGKWQHSQSGSPSLAWGSPNFAGAVSGCLPGPFLLTCPGCGGFPPEGKKTGREKNKTRITPLVGGVLALPTVYKKPFVAVVFACGVMEASWLLCAQRLLPFFRGCSSCLT